MASLPAPGNTTIGAGQTDGAVVDLFGWSTVAKYYGIDISTDRDIVLFAKWNQI